VTVHGTKAAAQRELRRLLREGDTGEHVAPDRITLAAWADTWLGLLDRGLVTAKTREIYAAVLRLHVLPTLGHRPLQQIKPTEIDALYRSLEARGMTVANLRHVHIALRSCLKMAVRKGVTKGNPAALADVPRAVPATVGQALDPPELKRLLEGLKRSVLFPLVATAALTGVRIGEALALRWCDLDQAAGTLRITRAIEDTAAHGRRFKSPKSKRGERTVAIDDTLLSILRTQRDKYLRLIAGVPDGVDVDLSLVRLPDDALMFPSPPVGSDLNLSKARNPCRTSTDCKRYFRRLGFPRFRFHDLRVTHATWLLNSGVPIHVAAARLGHSPAVMLSTYAKWTKGADATAVAVIGELTKGVL
jgi:integrase